MRKRYKIWLVIIVILILLLILLGLSKLFRNNNNEDNRIKNVTSVEMDIKEYGYTLDNRDSRYMRDEFQNLKEILEKEEIDYKELEEYKAIQRKIQNVPPCFNFTRKGIIESVDDFIEYIQKENISRNKSILKSLLVSYLDLLTK